MTPPAPPLLQVEDLKTHYPVRGGVLGLGMRYVYAVDGISFSIERGETLGLVGESGCGKSTVGKSILKLVEPTSGRILIEGDDITRLSKAQMHPYRRRLQVIFQDPYASLNQRMRAGEIVAEPLLNYAIGNAAERSDKVDALFEKVGLRLDQKRKFPHEFSGGQRQRIGIARALALNPNLIIGDEPVSALDVSVQAQVINLLMDLQKEFKLSYLFIAHDLAVVQHISHRIGIMYLGKLCELTEKNTLFRDPLHPYTEALLQAVPEPNPRIRKKRVLLTGDVPSPMKPPSGCRFRTRCPLAMDECARREPPLREAKPGHLVACHLR